MNTDADICSILQAILHEEIRPLDDYAVPLKELKIDSFGLVILRGRVEQALGHTIGDEVWCTIATPADVLALASDPTVKPSGVGRSRGSADETRRYSINMPQMAVGGLSESWLFKELGDLHWSMITRGLGSSSSSLADGNGNRLYATFTRIAYSTVLPLGHYRENDEVALRGTIARTGAGTFISKVELLGHQSELGTAQLMSNFSRRGDASNTSLLKGQPDIPVACPIPEVELTAFARDYRTQRAKTVPPVEFECEYELVPYYDLNGVGLLYFAAYPIISDICCLKYERDMATTYSTTMRDIYYFANTNPDDTIVFRIHSWKRAARCLRIETSLSRKSDGTMMAYMMTDKA